MDNQLLNSNSSNFAIVRAKGKQMLVHTGDIVIIDKIKAEPGQEVRFEDILATGINGNTNIGESIVKGVQVLARVLEHKRDAKVISFKKKRRHGFKKKIGHRQNKTVLKIEDIIV